MDLLKEAQDKGYVSPIPRVLALITSTDTPCPGPWDFLPGWQVPIGNLRAKGILAVLREAITHIHVEAPNSYRVFTAMQELPLASVEVVFLGQDPYPGGDSSALTLKAINALAEDERYEVLGLDHEYLLDDNGRINKVPYAIGKSFAYPSICQVPPGSYRNLQECAKRCFPGRSLKMDPELNEWSKQGVLMLNACPTLYHLGRINASSKCPNAWTAWTSEILSSIAINRPACVFVLVGNAAKTFKSSIVSANAGACVIETSHPSSRNKNGNFVESRLFSQINTFRETLGVREIMW